MGINNHAIELVDDWKLFYGPIYSLDLVKLEILKTYIKNNLANNFIKLSKSLVGISILFDKKPDGNLSLYIDYQGLNNLIIKNPYPLYLVGESLDWLGWTWHFTKLNLTNAYHRMKIWEGDEWKMTSRTWYG